MKPYYVKKKVLDQFMENIKVLEKRSGEMYAIMMIRAVVSMIFLL